MAPFNCGGRCLSWLMLLLLVLWRSQNLPNSATIAFNENYSTVVCVLSEFRSPRVVLFNWKACPNFILLLLPLCGDIHLNPGPDDFPCGLCGELVSDDDRAICCDGCNKWIHVSCDQYTTEEAYDDFVLHPSSEPWFCNICIGSDTENSSETQKPILQCICLNARSLLPKRYDLLGYLSSLSVDIVAVTETFLDDSVLSSQFCPPHFTPFCRDRDRHGGGVLILIRSSIPAIRRTDLETHCEMLWIEVHTRDGPLLFGVFYRPPNSDATKAGLAGWARWAMAHPIIYCLKLY